MQCGYELLANKAGFDAVVKGLMFNFKCNHCQEIVNVLINERMVEVKCPHCNNEVTSTWNPIDGRCPKCEGQVEPLLDTIILAD